MKRWRALIESSDDKQHSWWIVTFYIIWVLGYGRRGCFSVFWAPCHVLSKARICCPCKIGKVDSPGHKSLPFYSLQSVSGTALAWIKPPFHIQSVTSLYTGRNTFTKINSLFYIFTTLHLVNMRAVPRTFALLVFISAIRPETQSWKENIVIFNFSWLRYFTFQMPGRGAGWTNWTSKLNEISVICSVICFTPGIE